MKPHLCGVFKVPCILVCNIRNSLPRNTDSPSVVCLVVYTAALLAVCRFGGLKDDIHAFALVKQSLDSQVH
jgi:hypothetical protein